ncbi:MAG: nucleotide exchange factor GrpE [Candidatus Micrarchaeota archaeon]
MHEDMKLVEHADIEELEGPKKIGELEEQILRLRADFENYKKRTEKENIAFRESSKADILNKILPILDELEIAFSHMETASDKDFKHGMELIYSKLSDLLKKEGVIEMKTLGETFDPYRHDAIRQGDGEEGKIVEIVQKGYLLNGKILRHAKVVVGKGEVKENE